MLFEEMYVRVIQLFIKHNLSSWRFNWHKWHKCQRFKLTLQKKISQWLPPTHRWNEQQQTSKTEQTGPKVWKISGTTNSKIFEGVLMFPQEVFWGWLFLYMCRMHLWWNLLHMFRMFMHDYAMMVVNNQNQNSLVIQEEIMWPQLLQHGMNFN